MRPAPKSPMAVAAGSPPAAPSVVLTTARRTPWRRRLDPRFVIGVVVVTFVVAVAVFAPYLTDWDPVATDLAARLKAPGWRDEDGRVHAVGTDELGRDLLARIIYGARISVLIGVTTVVLTCTVGVLLGVLSGYYRGMVEHVSMRIADIQLAFPFLLLAIAIMAVLRPSLVNVILVLGVTGWVGFARLARAQTLGVATRDYITSARVIGCSDRRIILLYLLPNIASSIIVLATYQVPQMILAEASLGFLGLGVQPPTPTWGAAISAGRDYLATAWWISTFPGLALMLTVVGIGLLGDWLRDTIDPTLRVTT